MKLRITYLLCVIILLSLSNQCFGAVSKTIITTSAGQLSTLVTAGEGITDLTVIGPMDATDIAWIRDNITATLANLDLSGATITGGFPVDGLNASVGISGTPTKFNTVLKSVKLPLNLSNIGQRGFRCCSALESIIIPYGTTLAGGYGFANCAALASVTLPPTLISLPTYCFSTDPALKTINSLNPVAATFGANAFGSNTSTSVNGASGFVPVGATGYDAWKNSASTPVSIWAAANPVETNMIVALSGPNGVISDYGVTHLSNGVLSKEYTFTPSSGYVIDSVSVNGVNKTSLVVNNKLTIDDGGTGKVNAYVWVAFKSSANGLIDAENYGIKVLQNPADQSLIISNTDLIKSVELISTNGKLIKKYHVNKGNINISSISKGCYVLKINTLKGAVMYKFIR